MLEYIHIVERLVICSVVDGKLCTLSDSAEPLVSPLFFYVGFRRRFGVS